MTQAKPTLWQLDISHYSEKVRWALDYKGVPHVRRSPLPGSHIPIAFALTRGAQRRPCRCCGWTAARSPTRPQIIAALEAQYPEPPLYPLDPEQRRRALELEDFFDEELGPHARLLPFHELTNEPGDVRRGRRRRRCPGRWQGETGWSASTPAPTPACASERDERSGAVRAREAIVAALDRLEAELEEGDGEFLVGDSLSVADVTAASLFYPVVVPTEGPLDPDLPRPPALERFREDISDRPGFIWVEETFRKHRPPRLGRLSPRSVLVGWRPRRRRCRACR